MGAEGRGKAPNKALFGLNKSLPLPPLPPPPAPMKLLMRSQNVKRFEQLHSKTYSWAWACVRCLTALPTAAPSHARGIALAIPLISLPIRRFTLVVWRFGGGSHSATQDSQLEGGWVVPIQAAPFHQSKQPIGCASNIGTQNGLPW